MREYLDVIGKCRSLGEEFQITAITERTDACEALLKEEDLICSVVDMGGMSGELFRLIELLLGREVFRRSGNSLRFASDWCITCEYGEDDAYWGKIVPACRADLSGEWELSGQSLIVTTSVPWMRDRKVVFLNTPGEEILYSDAMAVSDKIVMLTSATEAFTKMQKDWMEQFIRDRFDTDRFSVYLCGMEYLTDENDEKKLLQYAAKVMEGCEGAKLFTAAEDVTEELRAPLLRDAARTRTVKNMVADIQEILESSLKNLPSEEDFLRTEQELTGSLEKLVRSGEITCENVLSNHIAGIKNAAVRSAEEYAEAMCGILKEAVSKAKDAEEAEKKIGPYLNRSWDHFTGEISKQIGKDYEVLYKAIADNMEEDIRGAFRDFAPTVLAILSGILTGEAPAYHPQADYQAVDKSALKNAGKNARNLLLLSIPTLFVAPEITVPVLLGSGVLFRMEQKEKDNNYRKELSRNAEAACRQTRQAVCDGMKKTLDKEFGRMNTIIKQGYETLADTLRDQLKKAQEQAEMTRQSEKRMREALDADLPEMIEALDA